MPIELVRDPREWQSRCLEARAAGRRIALVPTMGFLHAGHASLLRGARERAGPGGLALASIFVNPAQFGPAEDLTQYPRDLPRDLATCEAAGVDWVLAPEPGDVYASGHETWIEVERTAQGLCAGTRPGHFRGVATVVAKLFHLSVPHVALFGEKDWQQLQVVRAMVRDLDFAIEVAGMPIVREADGLALSSRNVYLSREERGRALALSKALRQAQVRAAGGEREAAVLSREAREALAREGVEVEYVEVVHSERLERLAHAGPGSRMLVAAQVGRTRLIDNVELP